MQIALQVCYIAVISVVLLSQTVSSYTRFTNIQCNSLDKTFSEFKKCRLTVPNRGVIALSVYVKLYELPANNVSINLSLLKKFNGYRPFLYNASADFCAFMTNKKRNPFINVYVDALRKVSNINHTCPYNHDIIVKNLILRDEMFRIMPIPAGEYMFKLLVGAYNVWKGEVKAYFSIRLNTEDG